jgi:type IV secretion system protein VirB9
MKKDIILILFALAAAGCTTYPVNQTQEEEVKDIYLASSEQEVEVKRNELEITEADNTLQKVDVPASQVLIIEKPVYYPIEEKSGTGRNPVVSPEKGNEGEMVYDYVSSWVYEVYCAPLLTSDIKLQPGEKLTGIPILGDTARWEITGSISVENGVEVSHIIVKPHTDGLTTSLLLTTTMRTYNLVLRSFKFLRTPIVSWKYPLENNMTSVMVSPEGSKSGSNAGGPTSLSYVSFDYLIQRGPKRPHWTPVMVYDDGMKTYIEFPMGALHREIPIARGRGGAIINTRTNGNILVIDRLIEVVILQNGYEKVKIIKQKKAK